MGAKKPRSGPRLVSRVPSIISNGGGDEEEGATQPNSVASISTATSTTANSAAETRGDGIDDDAFAGVRRGVVRSLVVVRWWA